MTLVHSATTTRPARDSDRTQPGRSSHTTAVEAPPIHTSAATTATAMRTRPGSPLQPRGESRSSTRRCTPSSRCRANADAPGPSGKRLNSSPAAQLAQPTRPSAECVGSDRQGDLPRRRRVTPSTGAPPLRKLAQRQDETSTLPIRRSSEALRQQHRYGMRSESDAFGSREYEWTNQLADLAAQHPADVDADPLATSRGGLTSREYGAARGDGVPKCEVVRYRTTATPGLPLSRCRRHPAAEQESASEVRANQVVGQHDEPHRLPDRHLHPSVQGLVSDELDELVVREGLEHLRHSSTATGRRSAEPSPARSCPHWRGMPVRGAGRYVPNALRVGFRQPWNSTASLARARRRTARNRSDRPAGPGRRRCRRQPVPRGQPTARRVETVVGGMLRRGHPGCGGTIATAPGRSRP